MISKEIPKTSSHRQVNINDFEGRDEIVEFEWQRFRVEKICSILRTIPNKDVGADLGCLSGMATALYAATGIKELHAFDISKISLDSVRAKGFKGFYWDADGEQCPMPDNTYDLLIAGEIIEHLIDTDRFAIDQSTSRQDFEHPRKHSTVCLQIDQAPRPRHRGMIGRGFRQCIPQKALQTQ